MRMTAEELGLVASEVKRFAKDLNLNEQQKEKLHVALAEAREKIGEYIKKNPNTSRADIIEKVKAHREEISTRVAAFLTPDQLTKWKAEVGKAKEFLGHKMEP